MAFSTLSTISKLQMSKAAQPDYLITNLFPLTGASFDFNSNNTPTTFTELDSRLSGTYTISQSSSVSSTYDAFKAVVRGNGSPGWVASTTTPSSTTLNTSETRIGEWIQMQLPFNFIVTSYTLQELSSGPIRYSKIFYLLGSNNGTTWYQINYTSIGSTVPTIINSSPLFNRGSVYSTTSIVNTVNSYKYFRVVVNQSAIVNDYEIDAFTMSGYWTAIQTVPSSNYFINNLFPLTNANDFTSINTPTTFTALESHLNGTYYVYHSNSYTGNGGDYTARNPINYTQPTNNGWTYYTTTPTSTTLNTGTVITGEWISVQLPFNFIVTSYKLTDITTYSRWPKIFYLLGSNNGSTWYQLDYTSLTSTPTTIITNAKGNQVYSTTKAVTTTKSYICFRVLVNLSNSSGQTASITDTAFLQFDFKTQSSSLSFDLMK